MGTHFSKDKIELKKLDFDIELSNDHLFSIEIDRKSFDKKYIDEKKRKKIKD
jgi:hypothetical protein